MRLQPPHKWSPRYDYHGGGLLPPNPTTITMRETQMTDLDTCTPLTEQVTTLKLALRRANTQLAAERGHFKVTMQTVGEELLMLEDYNLDRGDIEDVIDTLNDACGKHDAPQIPYPGKVEDVTVTLVVNVTFQEVFVPPSGADTDAGLDMAVEQEYPNYESRISNLIERELAASVTVDFEAATTE